MRAVRRGFAVACGTSAVVLGGPIGVAAAVRPGVSTGRATGVTTQGAVLTGLVNPAGRRTTYAFQYGATTRYGARTPAANAGRGRVAIPAAAAVGGLAPNTRYHYRLIAHNSSGTTRGADRVFRTAPQPLGFVLGATPNPVRVGRASVISGQLTGTGSAGRAIQLQALPFPYTVGFFPFGNAVVTDAQGRFSVSVLTVPITTLFRAVVADRPAVVSPVLSLGARAVVHTRVSRTRVPRGGRVRFSGTIRPAEVGRPIAVQRRRRGRWVTVAGMAARRGGRGFSTYRRTIRVRRDGRYRIFLGTGSGATVPNVGRAIRIRVF